MTHSLPDPADLRLPPLRAWLATFSPDPAADLRPAVGDASARRYWRVTLEGVSRVVMDVPPQSFDFANFLAQHQRLLAVGAPVPAVLAFDAEQGFALLEDLGETPLSALLQVDSVGHWYALARELLLSLQRQVDPAGLPPYDAAFLRRELELCREWYFGQQLGVTLTADELAVWERSCELIVARNLAQPTAYVHRDFHSRNLMVKEGALRLIDYQDAVCGPLSYDLVSLLRDAYVEWDEALVLDQVIRYWEKAREIGLPVPADLAEFYRDVEWQGLQRHLKVLGIFARLKYRDGKTQYQADIPRVLGYVHKVCERYVELAGLRRLLAKLHQERLDCGYTF